MKNILYPVYRVHVVCTCTCMFVIQLIFHVAYNIDDDSNVLPYFEEVVQNSIWFLKVKEYIGAVLLSKSELGSIPGFLKLRRKIFFFMTTSQLLV